MAVVIRDDAWPRIRAFAAKMGWPERAALGMVVMLWRESQALGLHEGTREQILFWCHAFHETEHCDELLAALSDPCVRLISPRKNSNYEIHGNKGDIRKVEAIRKQRVEAANKRWKTEKRKSPRRCEPQSKSNAFAMPILNYTENEKTAADSGESAPRLLPVEIVPREPVGSDVWSAYRAAYFAAYGVEPVRNAKANTLCKQLVQRLGGDGAVSVVKFFLTHRQAYYVTRLHPLSACVADAEALHTQMLANHRVSSSDAREADKNQANAQTFERVAAKLEAERLAKEAEGGSQP